MLAIFFGGFLAIRSAAKEFKLAKLKSDFVATVSHEFRTPLHSIRYLAELLQRGRVHKEDKKQLYYGTITNESRRLSRLIENILDFSKIEAGMKEYKFEETDIAELTKDVASHFQEQVDRKEFLITSEISNQMPKVLADREAISRVLFNLLYFSGLGLMEKEYSWKCRMKGWVSAKKIRRKFLRSFTGLMMRGKATSREVA
jgi:signal transduction histidine kinase